MGTPSGGHAGGAARNDGGAGCGGRACSPICSPISFSIEPVSVSSSTACAVGTRGTTARGTDGGAACTPGRRHVGRVVGREAEARGTRTVVDRNGGRQLTGARLPERRRKEAAGGERAGRRSSYEPWSRTSAAARGRSEPSGPDRNARCESSGRQRSPAGVGRTHLSGLRSKRDTRSSRGTVPQSIPVPHTPPSPLIPCAPYPIPHPSSLFLHLRPLGPRPSW